jgi:hypothetical protein
MHQLQTQKMCWNFHPLHIQLKKQVLLVKWQKTLGSSFTLRLPAYVPDEVAQAELEEGLAQMLDSNGEAQS